MINTRYTTLTNVIYMSSKMHFYGSLRVGQYNYKRFKEYFEDNLKYQATNTFCGFKMFGVKGVPYPFVVKTDNPKDSIEVDTMICNKECASTIDDMEEGAGYIKVNHNSGTIYVVDQKKLSPNAYHIESGNWLMEMKKLQTENE